MLINNYLLNLLTNTIIIYRICSFYYYTKRYFSMNIRLKNLVKTFENNTKVIKNINLEVEDGTLVSLLGPSGCGKTTILHIIAGLLPQTSGEIYFNDTLVSTAAEHRNIGMVFQNYALYPHLSAFENLAFPLKMQKIKKQEIAERVKETAAFLKIDHILHKKPRALSGGEQQRVAIGRALIKKPAVLLMDEPLSNLDKKLRVQTREEIRRIQQTLKITTVFVTHDQEEASAISDKIILLNNGSVLQYGTPYELYNSPENLFAAQFIGNIEINIFDARKNERGIFLPSLDCSIDIREKIDSDVSYLAIRPENIYYEKNFPDFTAKIIMIESLGKDAVATLETQSKKMRVYLSADHDFKIGQTIGMRLDKNKILLFNTAGKRIKGVV